MTNSLDYIKAQNTPKFSLTWPLYLYRLISASFPDQIEYNRLCKGQLILVVSGVWGSLGGPEYIVST